MNANELFQDIDKHIMNDYEPAEYMNSLFEKGQLNDYPFSMLKDLARIDQSPQHHPEGNVWNHTMMVLNNAAQRREFSMEPRAFMWAALLHDLGKVPATKIRKGKITAYDHDKMGKELAVKFLEQCNAEQELIGKVVPMVRWHMQILYVVKDLPFANIDAMLNEVALEEIALLCLCDRMGRGELDERKIRQEEENVRIFIEKCRLRRK